MNINTLYQFNNIIHASNKPKCLDNHSIIYRYNLSCDTVSFNGKTKPQNDLTESATLNKLFTPEFTPKRRVNEDGYLVTTVIDKNTNKPAEVYVKKMKSDGNTEDYYFYEKSGNEYIKIAEKSFDINYEKKRITPGYMETEVWAQKKYAGLGIRGHQIAVERMMQLGFDNVEIESIADAFPFHYKCGFRPIEKDSDPINLNEKREIITSRNELGYTSKKVDNLTLLNKKIEEYSKSWDIPEEDIRSKLIIETTNGQMLYHKSASIGNIFEYLYLNNKPLPKGTDIPTLRLSKKALNEWTERAKSQPILLGLE